MTLQDLGNIGEIVGAIAVVLSLAYLAVQIRQNTRVVRSATVQAQTDAHTRYMGFLAQDPELIRLLRRGASGEPLDQDESLRLRFLFHLVFGQLQAAYSHHRQGILSLDEWEHLHRVAATWLSSPAAKAWWAQDKRILRNEFAKYIDTTILRSE